MILGKRYKAKAFWQFATGNGPGQQEIQTGKCVYIHPKGRFCVLEFRGGIRCSYYPEDIREA